MGQQSLKIKNRLSIIDSTKKELLEMANERYLHEHFLLGCDIDEDKLKHNLLIKYALCTTNCEVIDWVWYKISGALLCEKKYEFDLVPQSANIYSITQYIKEENTWDAVQW